MAATAATFSRRPAPRMASIASSDAVEPPGSAAAAANPDASLERAHAAIAAAAAKQGATASRLVNGAVSRHSLPSTVSFANLAAMHTAVKEANRQVHQYDFVATSALELVFSSRFRFAPPPPPATDNGGSRKKRQREARDDQEDAVVAARKRLARVLPATVPSEELDVAQDVLTKLVTQLRGPSQEILVQSYAMLGKKLQPSDERPRIVLALRLNAGIPVPVSQLKRCLGVCWRDGVVSTASAVSGVCDHDLPLTEEGAVSMEMGNAPMLLVTSVPLQA